MSLMKLKNEVVFKGKTSKFRWPKNSLIIFKIAVIVSLIILFILGISLIGCSLNRDNNIIQTALHPELPGYSSIKILSKEGEWTGNNPRILKFQATVECYPNPVVCEGQIIQFYSDPSYLEVRWSTLEGAGLSRLVHWARNPLTEPEKAHTSYYYCQPRQVSLMLKYWVDRKFIRLEDIKEPEMYKLVNFLIINPPNTPNGSSNNDLFDSNNITTTDLAPDLPADKKVSVYVLRSTGKIDLYLAETISPTNSEFKLQSCDTIIWTE